jgi:hypothetical protein
MPLPAINGVAGSGSLLTREPTKAIRQDSSILVEQIWPDVCS